ncbi:MAG: hypothetical protein N2445_06835, partial [Acidobacteria bacterium]|nr:hypothetical protein [Acidobacteriota bacterium]
MARIYRGLSRYPKLAGADRQFLLVNEIYKSINGEGTLQGYPTVIIRLMGCNLRCSYCDTKHAYFQGKKESFEKIIK